VTGSQPGTPFGVARPTSSASGPPLVEVDSLSVSIQVDGSARSILRNVSLTIGRGEALALVGESGSGKSMTAKAIDRLLPAGARQTGSISFDGQDVAKMTGAALRSYRADVAMIFQDPRVAINPVRSIGDFMTEVLRTNTRVRSRVAADRAVKMLARVGIADGQRRLEQYPHELSGGLLQRVMIASSLLTEPRLLLADEPTTALDVSTQAEVIEILNDLRRELGLAVLFITHDLELARTFCDRTAVMYAGEIVEVGDSSAVQEAPLHPYSAGLAAARPRVDRRLARLEAIPGRPLSAVEAPDDACSFAPRCVHRVNECDEGHPELRPLGLGMVRCIRAGGTALTEKDVNHEAHR
jgi:oligopeptide/dipeptide ABC transporter ATP-binding protein